MANMNESSFNWILAGFSSKLVWTSADIFVFARNDSIFDWKNTATMTIIKTEKNPPAPVL